MRYALRRPKSAAYSAAMVLDMLFAAGQAASVLLLLYGAWLSIAPPRRTRKALDEEALLMRHLQSE